MMRCLSLISLAGSAWIILGAAPIAFGAPDDDPAWQEHLAAPGLTAAERGVLEKVAGHLDPASWKKLAPARRRQLLDYANQRMSGQNPFAICWHPETSMEIIESFHGVEHATPVRGQPDSPAAATQLNSHWSRTATNGSGQGGQGRPVTLSWSIVRDGTPIPSAFMGDSNDPSDFRSWIVGIYGGDASLPPNDPVNNVWFSIFADMFAKYSAQTGLRYIYEPNDDGATLSSGNSGILGVRGDIRIGAHDIDGNGTGQGNTLAYNFFPDIGDMVLDSNDSFLTNTGTDSRRLRNIIEHEHGHGIGLSHVCPVNQTKLMEPFISLNFLGLQFDDIYSAQRHYGDPLEVNGPVRDNDSVANAAPLPLTGGSPYTFQWLSIDDNADIDYLSFTGGAGSIFTTRVIPGNGQYLEGPQGQTGSCTSGTNFNSSAQQNLVLELLGPDQSVLATANATGAGGTEQIVSFPLTQSGTHYIRVSGGTADSAQLYRLESSFVSAGVSLLVQSQSITTESLLPANGVVDPGETVQLQVEVTNIGTLDATNVQGTLSGSGGFTGFTPVQDYGNLPSSGSQPGSFVFALSGAPGDSVSLDLTLTADGDITQVAPLTFSLGRKLLDFSEGFDGGGGLPPGWTSAVASNGSGWSVVSSDSASAPSSLFASDVDSKGESVLTSPEMTATGSSGILSFWHRYNTETNFDGGVLEVAVNGGEWTDIVDAGGSFAEGGYIAVLTKRQGGAVNPISNRNAWTGNSGGFVQSVVNLPGSMLGVPLRFRWRIGHDRLVGAEGWYIDDVTLDGGQFEAPGQPTADLVVVDGITSEGDAADTAEVQAVTPLPLLGALAVPLVIGGTADDTTDVTGLLGSLSIPAGSTAESIILSAIKDSLVEGPETVTFDIDSGVSFLPGGNGTAEVTVADTPYGQWAFTNLGLGGLNDPCDDFDGDVFKNLEEYSWGTDATSALSYPVITPLVSEGQFRINAPVATLPSDVIMTAEGSSNLIDWDTTGIIPLADGFGLPLGGAGKYFLRLLFDLEP